MTNFTITFRLVQKHFSLMISLQFSNKYNSIHHAEQFHTCFILSGMFNVCIDGIKNTTNNSDISEDCECKLSSSWIHKSRPESIADIQQDFINITRKTVSALKCIDMMKEQRIVAINVTKKP